MSECRPGNSPEWGLETVSFNLLLPEIKANGADSDQTLLSAASDLGLLCLPMPQSGFTDNPRYTLTSQ